MFHVPRAPCFATTMRYTEILAQEIKQRFKDEFSFYAIYEWPNHAAKIKPESLVCSEISGFLRGGLFPSWRELWELETLRQYEWWGAIRNPDELSSLVWEAKSTARKIPGTALYYAALFGFKSVAEELLANGHDPNEAGGRESYPLIAALTKEHMELAELLLEAKAKIDVKHGPREETVLHRAVEEANNKVALFLVKKKANVAILNIRGLPPLHVAVRNCAKRNQSTTRCGGKYWNDREINHHWQSQFHELLHHHLAEGFETLGEESIIAILFNLILISSGTSFCFDHRLNSLRHALNQMISLMILKVIPNINDCLLHCLHRGNMFIFL